MPGCSRLIVGEVDLRSTLRLECSLSTAIGGATAATIEDVNDAGRLGWHEMTVTADAVQLAGSGIPSASVSRRLTSYPADRLASPLNHRVVALRWIVAPSGAGNSGAASPDSPSPRAPGTSFAAVDAATRAFTGLIGRKQLTLPFALLALLLAVGLGGMHALAPGHGKTIMAGYPAELVILRRSTLTRRKEYARGYTTWPPALGYRPDRNQQEP